MLPREHGSWAVFLVPVFLGLFAVPGAEGPACALFLIGAMGAFLARTPIVALARDGRDRRARSWLAAYAVSALAGFAPLLLLYDRMLLLVFAAAAALLLVNDIRSQLDRRGMSLANEIFGILGLTLGAPAAYYAAHGRLSAEAWLLWAVCALYFAGPIFHVKLAALQHRAAADPSARPLLPRANMKNLIYHVLTLCLVISAVHLEWFSWPAIVPFAAASVKAAWRAAAGPGRVDFKRLGYQEVGFSVLFLAAMLAQSRCS